MNKTDIVKIFKETKNSGGKIAVAVEGGGLRGIVSASMLKIFEDLGLADQIDGVAGTSAGALNLCYFLNNDMDSGLQLYKVLASSEFIQPMKWPNAMNLEYLFNKQIAHHFKIDWENLRNHPTTFYISMTNVDNGKGRFIRAQETASTNELIRCVKASTSAPLFSTNKEFIQNEFYNDGQVQYSIPIEALTSGEYDLVFCLLTRKKGYKKSEGLLGRVLKSIALRKYSKDYQNEFSKNPHYYNKTLERVFSSKIPKIIPLYLEEDDFIVSKMTKNPDDMQKCIDATLKRFT